VKLDLLRVRRRETDVAAFAGDHAPSAVERNRVRDAEPGAGADHESGRRRRLDALLHDEQAIVRDVRDAGSRGVEVVDEANALDAEAIADRRRVDRPRGVGELRAAAVDRAGDREARAADRAERAARRRSGR
jgi:hypothetical protein